MVRMFFLFLFVPALVQADGLWSCHDVKGAARITNVPGTRPGESCYVLSLKRSPFNKISRQAFAGFSGLVAADRNPQQATQVSSEESPDASREQELISKKTRKTRASAARKRKAQRALARSRYAPHTTRRSLGK